MAQLGMAKTSGSHSRYTARTHTAVARGEVVEPLGQLTQVELPIRLAAHCDLIVVARREARRARPAAEHIVDVPLVHVQLEAHAAGIVRRVVVGNEEPMEDPVAGAHLAVNGHVWSER